MLTNILLIVLIIELFFMWMHLWGINKSTFVFRKYPEKDLRHIISK